jgi:hypothetical protein
MLEPSLGLLSGEVLNRRTFKIRILELGDHFLFQSIRLSKFIVEPFGWMGRVGELGDDGEEEAEGGVTNGYFVAAAFGEDPVDKMAKILVATAIGIGFEKTVLVVHNSGNGGIALTDMSKKKIIKKNKQTKKKEKKDGDAKHTSMKVTNTLPIASKTWAHN